MIQMKKKIGWWLGWACLVATSAFAQNSPAQPDPLLPYLNFLVTDHNFGTIQPGTVVEFTFKFTNTGKTPLLIAHVRTTCGCTATEWTRTPVAPGERGFVTARFNTSGTSGQRHKVITVISNAANEQQRIWIRANVVASTP